MRAVVASSMEEMEDSKVVDGAAPEDWKDSVRALHTVLTFSSQLFRMIKNK